MPDEKIPLERSAAKDIDPNGLDGTSLGEQEIENEFNQAAYDKLEQEMSDDGRNSEQVEKDRPENNMTPPPEIAQQVDREAHKGKMSSDHEGTMLHNEDLNKYDKYLENNPEIDDTGKKPDNGIDYSNGM